MILMCLGPYKTRTGHISRSTGQWGHTKRRRDRRWDSMGWRPGHSAVSCVDGSQSL